MLAWPFKRGDTVGSVLLANKNLGPGFDDLRLLLSLIIFSVHAGAITNGRPDENLLIVNNAAARAVTHWQSWREPLYLALVPTFFALSGFLVTSSAFRLRNVRSFLLFRALRIVPALSIEVTLSAVVLGPAFTTVALSDYFTDHEFYRYFGNIIGFVTYFLPGVFSSNPVRGVVNNNLWTLPPEFYCYLVLAIGMAVSLVYSRTVFTALFIVGTLCLLPVTWVNDYGMARGNLPTPVIVYYFFCGCLFYHWRDRIRLHWLLFAGSGVLSYACFYVGWAVMIAPLILTYFTVAIGMTRWPRVPLVKRGDYSYGIYLYGFPISQALIAAWPGFTAHPYVFRGLALLLTAVFAVTSWHVLEKPALSLKKRFAPSKRQLVAPHLDAAGPAAKTLPSS